jgi:hypothetical protein
VSGPHTRCIRSTIDFVVASWCSHTEKVTITQLGLLAPLRPSTLSRSPDRDVATTSSRFNCVRAVTSDRFRPLTIL